ncbi:MAG: crossover junction endodeoxyribonuclease RuvC [Anaerolinea sp.]|nr:crossover junction endodeoxyribonuclease RuvC [Anaerolinea sp.]
MRILGIDPGTATTGYGVVEDGSGGELATVSYGTILTPAGIPLEKRLLTIFEELNKIIRLHQPQAAAVEKLFFYKNVTTAMSVGQARGVVVLCFAQAGLSIGEYTPLEVKQAVTGYGNAEKKQVQEMVKILLNMDMLPKPDDAADALAVAICHHHHQRYTQLTGEIR